jgi:hypothetical protein
VTITECPTPKTPSHPFRKLVAAAVLAAVAVTASGCFGQFALTRKVYAWNGEVSQNKFANSLVFFALVVIPVYELCAFGDWIIFNTVEVFTGENPMSKLDVPGGHDWVARRTGADAVEVSRDGTVILLGQRAPGGSVTWRDVRGGVVAELPAPVAPVASR